MINLVRLGFVLAVGSGLMGCAVVPDSIVTSPLNVRPTAAQVAPIAQNGSIYQASTYRPLFEDRKARHVGDLLTIAISEKTTAGKQASSSASKSGSASAAVPGLFGVSSAVTSQMGVSANSATKREDKATEASSNTFTGTISVSVVEVLPNGNLVVAGEKQVAFDQGVEYIRISGVVNPDQIAPGNVVPSSQVAEAKVEYRTNTRLDKAAVASAVTRLFSSIAPF